MELRAPQHKTGNGKHKTDKMSKKIDFQKSLTGLNEQDLTAKIKEDELRMKKLSFAHAISPLENPQSIRSLRRDIARLKTALKKVQTQA